VILVADATILCHVLEAHRAWLILGPPGPFVAAHATSPVWQDPTNDLSSRVKDLLAQLTLEEKATQLNSQQADIPRLNISGYNFWTGTGLARLMVMHLMMIYQPISGSSCMA
jgi:hypothetical protein